MRFAPWFLAAALIATMSVARAEPPDDATKTTARKIAQEGLDLYDAGKYQEALERFVRADAMVHAPTMLLMAGRALVKLGRLVEAADKLGSASQMLLDAKASDAFREAVQDATKEREALMPRIPSVTITVDAPADAEVKVSIDGAVVPASTLGQKRYIDPGAHTIEASAAGTVNTVRVDLKEGENRPVRLDLGASDQPAKLLRTVGWVALSVGAAGVVVGAITGGLAIAKNDELGKAGCKDGFCPLPTAENLDSYKTLRLVSGGGLIAGGVLLAGGAALVIALPSPKPVAGRVHLTPWVGVGRAGLQGAF